MTTVPGRWKVFFSFDVMVSLRFIYIGPTQPEANKDLDKGLDFLHGKDTLPEEIGSSKGTDVHVYLHKGLLGWAQVENGTFLQKPSKPSIIFNLNKNLYATTRGSPIVWCVKMGKG